MRENAKRRKRLMALVIIAVGFLLIVMLIVGAPRSTPALPNPNGYDDFLKAASLLRGDYGNAPLLDQQGLQVLISTNAEALHLLRLGLSRQCSLPTDAAMTNESGMLADLANLKRLAQLLAAEGRLHEMDNEPLAAARSYLDVIRFGNDVSRGGFIINRLVGIACEAIGNTPLTELAPKLSPDDAHKLIFDLEKIDSAEITLDEVRRGESRFVRYQIRQQRFNPVLWVMGWWHHMQSIKRTEMRHNRVVAHEHLLTAELALRCEKAEHGRAPPSLKELVPQYLQRVPSDPYTGRALIYRPLGTNWLLYSVGTDGVDDGGKPAPRGLAVKGDIFYDSPY